MKKKLLTLSMIFVLLFTTMLSASSISDVSRDHWAYESVKTLIDRGLLQLYEDGTFRGHESISRFQLAVIISRILEEVEGKQIEMTSSDMELLRKLSIEFQDELVDLAIMGEAFSAQIQDLNDKNLIQDEFLTEIKAIDIPRLEEKVDSLNEKIGDVESDVSQIIESILRIRTLEEQIAVLESISEEQKVLINSNKEKIEELKALNIQTTDEMVDNLDNRISINATRLNSLQLEMDDLRSELQIKNNMIEELEQSNASYRTYLYGVAGISLILLLLSN
ncbi:S-layer homology domain-containing protein [Natronospora cellulosivora (SeqCode)]